MVLLSLNVQNGIAAQSIGLHCGRGVEEEFHAVLERVKFHPRLQTGENGYLGFKSRYQGLGVGFDLQYTVGQAYTYYHIIWVGC